MSSEQEERLKRDVVSFLRYAIHDGDFCIDKVLPNVGHSYVVNFPEFTFSGLDYDTGDLHEYTFEVTCEVGVVTAEALFGDVFFSMVLVEFDILQKLPSFTKVYTNYLQSLRGKIKRQTENIADSTKNIDRLLKEQKEEISRKSSLEDHLTKETEQFREYVASFGNLL